MLEEAMLLAPDEAANSTVTDWFGLFTITEIAIAKAFPDACIQSLTNNALYPFQPLTFSMSEPFTHNPPGSHDGPKIADICLLL